MVALLMEQIIILLESEEFVWETPRTKEYTNSNSIKSTFTLLEKDIAEYIINNLLNNSFICVNQSGKEPEFYYFNGVSWILDIANVKIKKIM